MKPIRDNDTIQLEITNFCALDCANCTRFCHHVEKPFFMDFEYFKKAVDSLKGFKHMVGVMGGEPLYHPRFQEMSEYLGEKFPFKQCGLWTTFPEGKERYGELIAKVYGNIFLNDHTRPDVLHHPFLVSSEECAPDVYEMWYAVNHCRYQYSWSASINPHGAFFCEIAASLSALLGKPGDGWDIEKEIDWWAKSEIYYPEQMVKWCPLCGGAMHFEGRMSIEGIDDISPKMFERLKDTSPKIKAGKYKIHDLQFKEEKRQPATYKDEDYRQDIAKRYGLFLIVDDKGFMEPHEMTIAKRLKLKDAISVKDLLNARYKECGYPTLDERER